TYCVRSFAAYFCFFFFSSRRRHTRSKRDWSSDVCSSDLRHRAAARMRRAVGQESPEPALTQASGGSAVDSSTWMSWMRLPTVSRSEERRVGKEGGGGWGREG